MITFAQITRVADRNRVDSRTVERDYVLMQLLAAIYEADGSGHLVLKGGTLLRACYFADYRYSADLDFSLTEGQARDAFAVIASVLSGCRDAVGFETLDMTERKGQWYVIYSRPQGRKGPIKLNVAEDELVGQPLRMPLIERYGDVDTRSDLVVYSLIEVAAEKLRCVIQRLQARDLFDLHYLLVRQGVDIDDAWELFERKARHKNLDPEQFGPKLEERFPAYEARWANELGGYIGDPPPFDRVKRELHRALRGRIK